MARPCKKRRVCGKPICETFHPADCIHTEPVILNLDEFECIRLMDYEGMDQEQCAAQMGVARTTVQAIYKSARGKIAKTLVEARYLSIEGGNVCFYEEGNACEGKCCSEYGLPIMVRGGNISMRIAVTYEDGQVFQHFGHCAQFKIYDVEGDQVVASQVVDTNGQGHGALAGFLKDNQVDMVICGGIGDGAREHLSEAQIEIFGGVKGDADAAVEAHLKGELEFDPNAKCDHHKEGHHHEEGHHHGEGHKCAGHHHGEGHKCGGHH